MCRRWTSSLQGHTGLANAVTGQQGLSISEISCTTKVCPFSAQPYASQNSNYVCGQQKIAEAGLGVPASPVHTSQLPDVRYGADVP